MPKKGYKQSEEHKRKLRKGRKNTKHSCGYILVYQPNHPSCNKGGYVPEHRLVMEKHIDRYISGTEVIHHINKIKDDNRIKNLFLCATCKEHRRLDFGWIKKKNKWFKICSGCKNLLEVNKNNFYFRSSKTFLSTCKSCTHEHVKKWRKKKLCQYVKFVKTK